MAKIKIFRQSGEPVRLEDREEYEKAFTAMYDRCSERAKLDILKLNRMVAYCERQLVKKYNQVVEVEVPKSTKAWNELIEKYEQTPIALAQKTDGTGLVMIIMDSLK